jgi:hypothetical protein
MVNIGKKDKERKVMIIRILRMLKMLKMKIRTFISKRISYKGVMSCIGKIKMDLCNVLKTLMPMIRIMTLN